jgi:hypothetical protein
MYHLLMNNRDRLHRRGVLLIIVDAGKMRFTVICKKASTQRPRGSGHGKWLIIHEKRLKIGRL